MNIKYITLIIYCLVGLYNQKVNAQVYHPNQNLLSNSDFMNRDPEQHPLNWVMGRGLQTIVISNKQKHGTRTDDMSVEFSDSSSTINAVLRSKKVIANPGSVYNATIWAKPKSGNAASFSVEFWNQNNKIIGSKTITPDTAQKWQELKLSLKAPDSCTHVTVTIMSTIANVGISYWDDAELYFEQDYNAKINANRREFFIDDYRIKEMIDVQRVVHPANKSKIVLKATEPWEGNSAYIYGTVLKNEPAGSGYRMWYATYLKEKYYMCYATSKDGINWVKPNLGVYEFNGSKKNNICREGGGSLVYDEFDKDPAKRYKLISFESSKELFGYHAYFSADGFTWTRASTKPILAYGDVSNIAYDKDKKLFIATTKQRMLISNTSVTPGKNDRAVFVSVSKDFLNWTAPEESNSKWTLAVEGDDKDDQLVRSKGGIEANVYGMTVYPYQGVYLGLPWMFDIMTYANGEFANTGDGQIQSQLTVSRDLRHWSRLDRDPVLPVGTAGAWDDGTVYTSTSMLQTDKEMQIYYGGMNLPHGGSTKTHTQYARIAIASWRKDGMLSLRNAGDDEGVITTKNIQFDGKLMKVNAKLKVGGSLGVEILTADGKPLNGFALKDSKSIIGDQYQAIVAWKGGANLSALKGKDVQIKFYLKGGDIYSYWFE